MFVHAEHLFHDMRPFQILSWPLGCAGGGADFAMEARRELFRARALAGPVGAGAPPLPYASAGCGVCRWRGWLPRPDPWGRRALSVGGGERAGGEGAATSQAYMEALAGELPDGLFDGGEEGWAATEPRTCSGGEAPVGTSRLAWAPRRRP